MHRHYVPLVHAFQRYMAALGTPTNPNTKAENHMWQSNKAKKLSKEMLKSRAIVIMWYLHSSVTLEERVYVRAGMTQEDLT